MRIVADTNVLVSARLVLVGIPAQIFRRIGTFEHLTSPEILAETRKVLQRRHITKRYHLTAEDIHTYLDHLREISIVVEPTTTPTVIEDDPTDDKFLAVAEAGGANHIISGDPHLTRLGAYHGITILTPAQFLELLKSREER